MTIPEAEAIGAISADVAKVLFDALHAHPELDWLDLVIAAATAMRGVTAHAVRTNPVLPEKVALQLLTMRTLSVFALPPELVRIFDDGNSDKDAPVKTGFIPVRKH